MRGFRYFHIIFVLLFLLPVVNAATLSGTVYNSNLNVVNDAIVSISTVPLQQYVAKDGTYTFEVPEGAYTLEVKFENSLGDTITQSESVAVEQEGEFVFDIIVFTGLDEVDILDEEISDVGEDLELLDGAEEKPNYYLYIFGALLIVGIILYVVGSKFNGKKRYEKQKDEVKELMEDDSQKVLNYIKESGGRVTQKMLRAKFPFSEAKVSLIVTELEHKGILQKLKKGKGNIIILKK